MKIASKDFDKIIGEEDKGGILVAGLALLADKPFGMARWYPSGISGQVSVSFQSEYIEEGQLYLNGIKAGDRILVVDDMISTGGTMIGLIQAIERSGAEIADIVCVAEKINYNGVSLIREKTGYEPKTLVKIDVSGEKSRVIV